MDKRERLLPMHMKAMRFFLNGVHGAEGEDEDGETPEDESTDEVASPKAATPTTRTYSQADLDKVITESKSYRKRAQEAEDKVSKFEKDRMGDLEKAQTVAKEEKDRADQAESEITRLKRERAIEKEANTQSFTDPADVIAFLNLGEVKVDDDGLPDTASLKAAITRLGKEKPYLIKGGVAGSGDGGARGGSTPDQITNYEKEYQSRGLVPIS